MRAHLVAADVGVGKVGEREIAELAASRPLALASRLAESSARLVTGAMPASVEGVNFPAEGLLLHALIVPIVFRTVVRYCAEHIRCS